jgi:hypothetical protein
MLLAFGYCLVTYEQGGGGVASATWDFSATPRIVGPSQPGVVWAQRASIQLAGDARWIPSDVALETTLLPDSEGRIRSVWAALRYRAQRPSRAIFVLSMSSFLGGPEAFHRRQSAIIQRVVCGFSRA